ncbi:MAG: ABC-F family ATP-binding cassette domain-containing protein [Bacteroidetes bacterium]|nr:ABC-F family ATP-binding cassette domain-containing protein [Bacteroidota bacterium]
MIYLSVENLGKAFADKVLFEGLSFGIEKGDKVSLVAKNGAGKSTLFKILMGTVLPDEGNVVFRDGIKVGWLEQDPHFAEGQTIEEYIYASNNPRISLIKKYQAMLDSGNTDDVVMEELLTQIDRLNAWDIENKIQEVLSSLNLNFPAQKTSAMSGGQKRRLALAKVLIEQPDLLLLDEPTNHLDLDMVEWLEKFLGASDITMLVITHDRYFLDNVCKKIIEIDQGNLYTYYGNYEYYLEKRAERMHNSKVVADKAKNTLRKEVDWLGKTPKARTTKAKYRIDAVEEIREVASSFKAEKHVEIEASNMSRLGNKIIELHNVTKSYGDKVILKPFTYVFKKGEKVGIIGKNGTGKTTILNIIKGIEETTSGRVETGHTVVIGYYSQQLEKYKPGKRVIDVLRDYSEVVQMAGGRTMSINQLLLQFQFDLKKQTNLVESLSGGERKRLQLLTVMIQNPNFLILDEPTNDLDLSTLAAIEQYLQIFEGCVIVVSHDRYFLDNVVDHLLVFKGDGEIQDFPGNYSQWRESKSLKSQEARKDYEVEKKEKVQKAAESPEGKKKLTYKEKLELEALEKEIAGLEARQAEIANELGSGTMTGEQINQSSIELANIAAAVGDKTVRWLELSEKDA